MALITLNLDDMEPAELQADIVHRDDFRRLNVVGSGVDRWLHSRTSRAGGGVGAQAEKLMDWRGLERRATQLRSDFKRWSEAHWKTLNDLLAVARQRGSNEVWIFEDETGPKTEVRRFTEGGLGWAKVNDLIKQGIDDPDKKGLMVKGEQAQVVRRLRERETTSRVRWSAYNAAFQRAVEARLRPFLNQRIDRSSRYSYHRPAVFIIQNDDRHYIVQTDGHGVLKWLDGDTYSCP